MHLNRRMGLGMRATFVVLAVACYFLTLGVLAWFPSLDQPNTMSTLQWLVGAIGLAVIGDTVRPSGQRASALALTTAPLPIPSGPEDGPTDPGLREPSAASTGPRP